MVEPERILVEEIKVVPAKVKVTDLVAVRHIVNTGQDKTEPRTTLILLCDDGSLRIFMASPEMTNFWLTPTLQPPILSSTQPKMVRKESVNGAKGGSGASTPTFPTDFFENCTAMNDVEFGGNDLLHVYNSTQLKHRLNTSGLYIACTKQSGFSVEVTNPETSSVIVGVRILVGSQEVQRAPTCVEIFGRNIPFVLQRYRWYDIPLTKEESLQADKKLVLSFGSSNDPLGVTMIDSIKVYGKTKEAFGWPEDAEDQLAGTGGSNGALNLPATQGHLLQSPVLQSNGSCNKLAIQSPAQLMLDQLVGGAVALLEGSLSLPPAGLTSACPPATKEHVLRLSTQILTMTWSGGSCVPGVVKQLLATIHPSRAAYHDYKDRVLLTSVLDNLKAIMDETSPIHLDPEAFYNVLTITKSVATTQPQNLIQFTTGNFLGDLLAVGRRLHRERARNPLLSPVGQLGVAQIDFCVQSIVDVLFSVALTDPQKWMAPVMDHYIGLLLCDDASVSHAAKAALQRTMKTGCAGKSILSSALSGRQPVHSDEDDIMQLAIAMSLEEASGVASGPESNDDEMHDMPSTSAERFRQLRLALLKRITEDLPELKKKGGVKSIHFLQVLLILVSELRPSDPTERSELHQTLAKAVCELDLERDAALEVAGQRTPQHEVQLLIMKFFGFLLSTHHHKSSSGGGGGGKASHSQRRSNTASLSTVASVAAKVLLDAGLMERCLVLLQAILLHWKATGADESPVVVGLLKQPLAPSAFDLSPFFSRTLTHRNTGYIFEGI
jgi:E3 ubiquitin-protein ligase UBR4